MILRPLSSQLSTLGRIARSARAPGFRLRRGLAASMGPLAEQSAARAETDHAEPDDLYVAHARAQFETHMRVSGPPDSWDYRYPEHLTGPSAANYPPHRHLRLSQIAPRQSTWPKAARQTEM